MSTLEPIFPITALQKKQAEVKEAARKDVVRITENGAGAFVFVSEDVYERKIHDVARQAAEDALIANAIERGRADIAAGRCYEGTEAFLKAVEERQAQYA